MTSCQQKNAGYLSSGGCCPPAKDKYPALVTRFLQRQLIQFVSESPEEVVAVAPVRLDLNVELEEDFFLEESLHVTPRRRADLLERLPTVTDDDALLRVASSMSKQTSEFSIARIERMTE